MINEWGLFIAGMVVVAAGMIVVGGVLVSACVEAREAVRDAA